MFPWEAAGSLSSAITWFCSGREFDYRDITLLIVSESFLGRQFVTGSSFFRDVFFLEETPADFRQLRLYHDVFSER